MSQPEYVLTASADAYRQTLGALSPDAIVILSGLGMILLALAIIFDLLGFDNRQ